VQYTVQNLSTTLCANVDMCSLQLLPRLGSFPTYVLLGQTWGDDDDADDDDYDDDKHHDNDNNAQGREKRSEGAGRFV